MANISTYDLLLALHDCAGDFLAFTLNSASELQKSCFHIPDEYTAAQVVRAMAASDPASFARLTGRYIAHCVCAGKIRDDVLARDGRWSVVPDEAQGKEGSNAADS